MDTMTVSLWNGMSCAAIYSINTQCTYRVKSLDSLVLKPGYEYLIKAEVVGHDIMPGQTVSFQPYSLDDYSFVARAVCCMGEHDMLHAESLRWCDKVASRDNAGRGDPYK